MGWVGGGGRRVGVGGGWAEVHGLPLLRSSCFRCGPLGLPPYAYAMEAQLASPLCA